jgi:hypothetical protein
MDDALLNANARVERHWRLPTALIALPNRSLMVLWSALPPRLLMVLVAVLDKACTMKSTIWAGWTLWLIKICAWLCAAHCAPGKWAFETARTWGLVEMAELESAMLCSCSSVCTTHKTGSLGLCVKLCLWAEALNIPIDDVPNLMSNPNSVGGGDFQWASSTVLRMKKDGKWCFCG